MDSISGLRSQIDYFVEHGFIRAAKTRACALLDWIFVSLDSNLTVKDKIIIRKEFLQCNQLYGRRFWTDANSKYRARVTLHGRCLGLFELIRIFGRLVEKSEIILKGNQ